MALPLLGRVVGLDCQGPVGIARQYHTICLADFIVHTALAAHRAGLAFTGFYRENTFRLRVGDEHLYPDCAFQIIAPTRQEYSFFVEVDNSSQRIRSTEDLDNWQRKIRLYDAFQDRTPKRFRILVVATRSDERLAHILQTAATAMRNPARSLLYGISLSEYLACRDALTAPCFRDHRGRRVALVLHGPRPVGATTNRKTLVPR